MAERCGPEGDVLRGFDARRVHVNFGEAVQAMKQGKDVYSPRFAKARTVACLRYFPATDEHDEFIAWIGTDGKWEPMAYTHTNVLAEDWEIVES